MTVAKFSHFSDLNKFNQPWQNLDCHGKIKPSCPMFYEYADKVAS